MQESFRRASSGLRKTTFDGRKVDATMRTKDHTAKPRQSAFGKEPQIKINVRFFVLLLGGDFSAIQIVN